MPRGIYDRSKCKQRTKVEETKSKVYPTIIVSVHGTLIVKVTDAGSKMLGTIRLTDGGLTVFPANQKLRSEKVVSFEQLANIIEIVTK